MTHDSIHHPAHYAEGRAYEPIDVIEDWELNYRLGNCVKYVSRAGRKQDQLEDLRKARWYLDREIEHLESVEAPPAPYEDILAYYGQTQDEPEAWPECDGSGFDATLDTVPFDPTTERISYDTTDHDWSDFWSGWDESVGPTEVWLTDNEIENVLAKKDLDRFEDDEIVSTIHRRDLILGVKKDGSTCVLKDGRCVPDERNIWSA